MKKTALSHTNNTEYEGFLRGALSWQGSVTPRILSSLLVMSCFPLLIASLDHFWKPLPHLDVTPFEYTGAVLGLVLVFRTNAGHERWWEARKLWGGIVNQSRNLVIATLNYGEPPNSLTQPKPWQNEIVTWTIVFAVTVKESLRSSHNLEPLSDLIPTEELEALKAAPHMPLYATHKIASLIQYARLTQQIDGLTFNVLEKQRGLLVDHLGGCERILKTPMPLVYGIKARRFILLFLLLLPFSLLEKLGFSMVWVFWLIAYPLLSLDRIGIELQAPFDTKSLSHLPLDSICDSIKLHCLALLNQSQN